MLASWFVDSVLDRTKNWKNFLLLANKNRMSVCVGGGGVLQVLTHLPPSASRTRVYMCVCGCVTDRSRMLDLNSKIQKTPLQNTNLSLACLCVSDL